MPITLSPPPFPTPDHVTANAASAGSDADSDHVDAFANLLQAAADRKADGPTAPTTPSTTASTPPSPAASTTASGTSSQNAPAQADGQPSTEPLEGSAAQSSGLTRTRANSGSDPLRTLLAGAGHPQSRLAVTNSPAATLPGSGDTPVSDAAAEMSKPLHRGASDDSTVVGDSMSALAAALSTGAAQAQATQPQAAALGTASRDGGVANAGIEGAASRKPTRDLEQASILQEGLGSAAKLADTGSQPSAQALAFAATLPKMQDAQPSDGMVHKATDELADVAAPAMSASAQPTTSSAPVINIDTPVNAPGWQGEFAGKLTQVVVMRSDSAEFHLHPAELGPVDVQISFAADQAVILITAPHAASRDALEQALPYLRDMLADQGINLGQASVQSESRQSFAEARPEAVAAGRELEGLSMPLPEARVVHMRGLVDTFA